MRLRFASFKIKNLYATAKKYIFAPYYFLVKYKEILLIFLACLYLIYYDILYTLFEPKLASAVMEVFLPKEKEKILGLFTFLAGIYVIHLLIKRTKTQDQILIETLFNNAVGYLAKDDVHIRISGIELLEEIATNHKERCKRVYNIFMDYLRYAPVMDEKGRKKTEAINTKNKIIHYLFVDKSTRIKYEKFAPAILTEAKLTNANLVGANLSNAHLQGAYLRSAQLQGANLHNAQLERAYLHNAQLQEAYLSNAQLQGAELHNAQLQGAKLSNAQLQGTDLSNAQLQGANLPNAQLQGANLSNAQLQGANLYNTQFQGADLRKTQFQGANLSNAQLQGANLFNTQLQEADLSNAQFQGAKDESVFPSPFEERMQSRIKENTALGRNVVSGGLTQNQVNQIMQDIVYPMSPEERIKFQKKLEKHVGKAENYDVEKKGAITGMLEAEEAEEIIAEYKKAMSHFEG